ncbi:P-type conjugative transfer protein VirB9 [Kingella negevensis]|uniref:P-type conjugative transfer protein VirB9 n=1 Tax=Kingella negevensis TaxID=1522312 RepID=UPI00254E99ED|nr:P-type conjugative transfer protein VirB9 [Kingella negevensis]MDK4680020.1 P-type conjugative transfer protein VirB9 [Kingella negevensis]MDK4682260.1 P-type conjugative transfer protein VirB9 [Kingella negevensis]MDK4690457.1 P-type conjugative transfer protein VirB9 [Kingella negevensis]MDK4692194.1 P-type conjugative transfer protein VirB9 [Kingella negevensis]MDK4698498.1 P-type conjugative transfer protein VirB9 [Kingella negevensis]
MKNKLIYLAMAAIVLPFSVQAANIPKGSPKDKRIQTAVYTPDDVFVVRTKVGVATVIQLENDERIIGESSAMGIGHAEAWKMTARGNNIFFKPTAEHPDTNLLITTNKRTYAFDLKSTNGTPTPTYILRFNYPDTAFAQRRAAAQKRIQSAEVFGQAQSAPPLNTNTNYWGRGNKHLTPTHIYDNGRFTYFRFNNGRDLPTIYKVLDDGSEVLLNTHMDGDTVVVHETAQQFVLRLNKQVLGIENRGFNSNGQFNQTGTDDNSSVRLLKGF